MFVVFVCFFDLKNNWFDFFLRVLVVIFKLYDFLVRTMNGEVNVLILVNFGLVIIID